MREHGVVVKYDEHVPEDQIGRILVLSAEVALQKRELLPELLGNHMLPWAGHYFNLLLADARLATYKGLAQLARATITDVQMLLGIRPPIAGCIVNVCREFGLASLGIGVVACQCSERLACFAGCGRKDSRRV